MRIMNSFKKLIDIYRNDPVKKCKVFLTVGCSHVDGYLCKYPNCSSLNEENINTTKT